MGRKKTIDFTPKNFGDLDVVNNKEERQLRGRIATLIRMDSIREKKIKLYKSEIELLERERKNINRELISLKNKVEDGKMEFPKFTVEEYGKSANSYYRGYWKVNSKKKFGYIGRKTDVFDIMLKKVVGFDKMKNEDKLNAILKIYTPQLRIDYWKHSYLEYKGLVKKRKK